MSHNRDAYTALVLLVICGVFFHATLGLKPPMFGQLSSALWPRMILVPLALLSLALLVRSQRGEAAASDAGLIEWFRDNTNPIICFVLFFLFILTMPVLGMLLGGIAYVFLTLSVLGGWEPRRLVGHAAISLFFVVGMWAIFTQALGVFLPEGVILRLL